MAEAVSPNIPPELSKLLSSGDQYMKRLQSTKAVVTYCKAYDWDPCVTRTHLTTLSPQALSTLISAMEDCCVCAADTSERFPLFGVSLTLEQLCGWITAPDMNPRSLVAWSLKTNIQMDRKSYREVVKTCSEALSVFSFSETSFLLQRALAYLHLGEDSDALNDYLAAYEGNSKAAKAYILETQAESIACILEIFYREIEKYKKKSSTKSASKDVNSSSYITLLKLCRFVLLFNPSDLSLYSSCADVLMALKKYKEAALLLSETTNNTDCDISRVHLVLQRAECYLEVQELDLALYDYVTASRVQENITISSILSLPQENYHKLINHATWVSENLLTQCRHEGNLLRTCCTDRVQSIDAKLHYAQGLYRLLFLLHSQDTETLLNLAECFVLQGNFMKAIETYSEGLALNLQDDSVSAKIYRERVSCRLALGELGRALEDCDAALCLEPDHTHTVCLKVQALLLANQLEKGVLTLAEAAKNGTHAVEDFINRLSPEEKETLGMQLRKFISNALQNLQPVKYDKDLLELVGKVLTKCFINNLDYYLAYVEVLLSASKNDEAQSILIRFISNNPDYYLARVHLAVLKINLGKKSIGLEEICGVLKSVGQERLTTAFERISPENRTLVAHEACVQGATIASNLESISLYTVAIAAANPVHAWTLYYMRASRYVKISKLDLALKDFTKALNRNPNHVQSYLSRAILLLKSGYLKESLSDLKRALHLDPTMLTKLIRRLPLPTKNAILKALYKFLQQNFRVCTDLKLIPLSVLLVESDSTNAVFHEVSAHAYMVFGKYGKALNELERAENLTPFLNTPVIGCLGLAHIMLNNFAVGTTCFSRFSEVDPGELCYWMHALNAGQKAVVAQQASGYGEELSAKFEWEQALSFWSVAIIATEKENYDFLRKRCECLRHLQNYPRAVDDITDVITQGTPVISDYCTRGSLRIQNHNLTGACADLMKALDMGEEITLLTLTTFFSELKTTANVFYEVASSQYKSKSYFEALNTCNYGLKIDRDNQDLQQLKQELDSGKSQCSIQ